MALRDPVRPRDGMHAEGLVRAAEREGLRAFAEEISP